MKRLNLVVGVFFFTAWMVAAHANNIFVAQTAQGSNTGADAADAHSAAWFNTSGNWGSGDGKINPGDTVHLTGTFSSALSVQASGTASNVTTILFCPGAKMSVAAWAATGALILSGTNYITVDGGATGTIGGPKGNAALANGIIENTDNGENLGNQVSNSTGIFIENANYITIKNLVVRNLYVRSSGTDEGSNGNQGVKTDNCSNVIVTNCIFHDNERGVLFVFRAGNTNLEYSYTTAYNCNWGGACGSAGDSCDLTGLLVHDNYFYGWSNWDDTSVVNNYHHNGFFSYTSFAQTSTFLTQVRYYNNQVGSGTSGEWGTRSSAGLFIQDKVTDVWWYNNLMISDGSTYPNDGLIYCDPQGAEVSTYRIYSNTLVGLNNSFGAAVFLDAWQNNGGAQTVFVQNNIMSGMRYPITVYDNSTIHLTAGHNLIYGNDASTPYSYSANSSGSFKAIAQWQALGFDPDLITSNPLLDGNYEAGVGSPAIAAGSNLSTYFKTDKFGGSRPSSGGWDIGAYERPKPPSNLRVVSQQ